MRIPVQINESSAEPLYHQIETQLRSLIVTGQVAEGTLLPSIREFAADLKCSVITIRRVYQDLENEGLLRTRQGTGTFVTRVDTDDREEYKKQIVLEAVRSLLDAARSVGYSPEELKALVDETLRKEERK
ncbi:GntR family transcriptional regulator [Saccharibacillus sp. CPCC 101409]|uniref:GntR family transcriptional regulator n=1 Tax=Saccharibacillus sp. CPCC 101409 TaxID=3058041 RepID=UPI00267184BA|nr:GntR family transcriptional regulator [Saccharibacillus sp. CPCC 101409]MDO3412618.1 GntR family transcriptional regulator [Saccharibacillus sp. CPCC 101409]